MARYDELEHDTHEEPNAAPDGLSSPARTTDERPASRRDALREKRSKKAAPANPSHEAMLKDRYAEKSYATQRAPADADVAWLDESNAALWTGDVDQDD